MSKESGDKRTGRYRVVKSSDRAPKRSATTAALIRKLVEEVRQDQVATNQLIKAATEKRGILGISTSTG